MTTYSPRIRLDASDASLPIGYRAAIRCHAAMPLQAALRRSIDIHRLLCRVPIFGQLSRRSLIALAEHMPIQAFGRGQTIFRQGERGDVLYLIARGHVQIYRSGASESEHAVVAFSAGEFFGELALLDDGPRSASAVALCPTIALQLGRATFRQLIRDHPVIAEVLLTELAGRLRERTAFGVM